MVARRQVQPVRGETPMLHVAPVRPAGNEFAVQEQFVALVGADLDARLLAPVNTETVLEGQHRHFPPAARGVPDPRGVFNRIARPQVGFAFGLRDRHTLPFRHDLSPFAG